MTDGSVPSVDRWLTSMMRGTCTSAQIVTARSDAPVATRPTCSAPASDRSGVCSDRRRFSTSTDWAAPDQPPWLLQPGRPDGILGSSKSLAPYRIRRGMYAVGRFADGAGEHSVIIVNAPRLRGSSERDHHRCAHLFVEDVMSAGALAGILVGLFVGGFIGALAMALVAAGSQRRSLNSEARSLEQIGRGRRG